MEIQPDICPSAFGLRNLHFPVPTRCQESWSVWIVPTPAICFSTDFGLPEQVIELAPVTDTLRASATVTSAIEALPGDNVAA